MDVVFCKDSERNVVFWAKLSQCSLLMTVRSECRAAAWGFIEDLRCNMQDNIRKNEKPKPFALYDRSATSTLHLLLGRICPMDFLRQV